MELQFLELTKETMKPTYVADINRLLPQLATTPQPCTDVWMNHLFDSGTRLFVARDDDRLVGTVLLASMVILVGQKYWIEDVIVDENYRRQGIANRLMDLAEQACRESGAKNINLTSNPDRGGARKMYGDRGYELRNTGVFRLTF